MNQRFGGATALLAFLLLLAPRSAHADNPDSLYMSGEAALMAGAITADTADTGSVWYNPAGLARSPALRFDVNVSAYALQLGGTPQLEGHGEGSKTETVSVLNFAAVPTAFSSVRGFRDVGVAVGVFIPQMGVTGLRSRVSRPRTDNQFGAEFSVNNYRTRQELFGGPAIGWQLSPRVNIGASFFIHYRAIVDVQDYRVLLDYSDERTDLVEARALSDWLQLGIAPTFGVQLQLTDRLRGGILMRLPSLRILQLLGYTESETLAVNGSVGDQTIYNDEVALDGRFLTPGRFNGGLSYQFDRLKLAIEGSYQLPYTAATDEVTIPVDESLRATINGRIGTRYQVKENFEVGGGFFTNLSTTKELDSLGGSKLNFYGVTLATKVGTPYKISERDGEKLSPEGTMRFGSTFAFTYALGVGKTLHGVVSDTADIESLYEERTYNVVAHEWVFSVGSSLFEQ